MLKPLGLLALTALAASLTTTACIFGGGEDTPSVQRPSSIPTATPPARLPAPILLGETQATGGTVSGSGGATGETTYVVKSGDTLNAIATQFGIPPAQQAAWVQEVLRLNGLPDASLLQSGVELRLPRVPATPIPTGSPAASPTRAATTAPTQAAASPTSAAQATATPRPTVAAGTGTYTVVSGDNPTIIAEKVGVPAAQIAAWVDQLVALNGINPNNLQVGQVLQLPPIPAAPTATP
jgi:LysM repeat protein